MITARACGLLLSDKGFWGGDHNGSIIEALTISLASIKPDKDLLLGPLNAFKGHFYDPDTGKNFIGGTNDTARSNTEKFYSEAKTEYSKTKISTEFVENVGKMLHYIQDANEPHHAANITALEKKNVHSKFEEYADQHLNECIDSLTSLGSAQYTAALSKTPGELVYVGAKVAKGLSANVLDVNNQSLWLNTARTSSRNAVQYSAVLLYKLSIEAGIPLTK